MSDPFLIEGPAVISFSGGRTSGYMLWRILQSHGGKLPDDVRVIFANTGKEMPETLDFVQECSERWGVPITWLEYRSLRQFAVVDYATASREGEPFEALIRDKNYLPNPVSRFCTVELKLLTMERYCVQSLGWDFFDDIVGLRADEQRRIAKLKNTKRAHFERWAPLHQAGIVKADVSAFWGSNDFDLALENVNGVTPWGNCDLCFLKSGSQLLSQIRQRPSAATWWIRAQDSIVNTGQISGDAARFRADRPGYDRMLDMALNHGEMFGFDDESIEDCACTD